MTAPTTPTRPAAEAARMADVRVADRAAVFDAARDMAESAYWRGLDSGNGDAAGVERWRDEEDAARARLIVALDYPPPPDPDAAGEASAESKARAGAASS